MKSTVEQKTLPVPICQSAIDGLSEVEQLFVPLLIRQGKIRVIPDEVQP